MKNYNQRSTRGMYVVVLLLLLIGIGYALISTTVNINGTAKIGASNWKVWFSEAPSVTNGSVTPETAAGDVAVHKVSDTLVEWTVTLKQPGDFYEFTVPVTNDGTIDAKLATLTKTPSSLTTDQAKVLEYTFEYGTRYDGGTDKTIAQNDLLPAGQTSTVKVRVAFKSNVQESDLPETAMTVNFAFGMNYTQK